MCTEFIISPVSNGWMVSIPSLQFQEGFDPTGGMLKMIPGIMKQITDPDSVEESKSEKPSMMRNKSVFVFSTIEEVLAFLAKQITDK